MHIQLTDINKRVNSLNSNFIKSEFNLSQMSPTNDKGAFVPSTAKYLIRNWKSFNEDTNKEQQLYDLRHEVIEAQIKHESALKMIEEYKEQINALQRKIIQLEAEKGRND